VPPDLKHIRERWIEDKNEHRHAAPVFLKNDKPYFEIPVSARKPENGRPIIFTANASGRTDSEADCSDFGKIQCGRW
jgi:hypothetical protein